MCFSAVASFSGAAIIAFIGFAICLGNLNILRLLRYKYSDINASNTVCSQIQRSSVAWGPALLTPILFAAQQCSEGIVWLAINRGDDTHVSAYVFCFFAFCLWPTWVPLVCLILEAQQAGCSRSAGSSSGWQSRLSLLAATLLLGFLVSIYTIVSLFSNKLKFSPHNGHIVYHFNLIDIGGPLALLIPYLYCTVAPFLLVRSVPSMWIMALCVGMAAIMSYILYSDGAFASTWCFFAAWLSIVIGLIRKKDAERLYKSDHNTSIDRIAIGRVELNTSKVDAIDTNDIHISDNNLPVPHTY